MGDFLVAEDVPGIDPQRAAENIAQLEAHLSLHYPCLYDLPPAKAALLKPLLVPIVRRWDEAGTGLTTVETTGPFTERKSGGGGKILWAQEIADLQALCGHVSGAAVSRGSFPPPESLDGIFVRRPGWS